MKKITITNNEEPQKTLNILEKVKSFKDACNVLGLKGDLFSIEFNSELEGQAIAAFAFTKLCLITRALNEGWTPDWSEDDEYKFYPYFYMEYGFSTHCVSSCCKYYTYVPSSLCFKTRALAEYAAKQFFQLYEDYFLIK